MKWHKFSFPVVMLITTLVLFSASQAMASGTEAGTSVSNTAAVSYTIDTTTVTDQPSNTVNFLVDQKVRVVVAGTPSQTVVANVDDNELAFTVTNDSNTEDTDSSGTQDPTWFQIRAVDAGGDDFNMDNVEIWEDTDNDGTPDINLTAAIVAGQSEVYLLIDVDEMRNLIIVADTPSTATTEGDQAVYDLIAEAWSTSFSATPVDADNAMAEDGDGNDPGASEIVFTDGTGTHGDAAGDGEHSAEGTYTVAAAMAVAKSVTNGASGYQLPGDTVTYSIIVTNNDTVYEASSVTIWDQIQAPLVYSDGSLSCTGGSGFNAECSNDNSTWDSDCTAVGTVNYVRCDGGTIPEDTGGTDNEATMSFDADIP